MLSNPNVSQIIPKAGNRYESALAIAKRARNIEKIFGLDLKSVSEKELQQIDGIGETLSKKIKQFADSY